MYIIIDDFSKTYDFDQNSWYKVEIKDACFGPLSIKELGPLFKDGRLASEILEQVLSKLFKRLEKASCAIASYDLIDRKTGVTYEVKCVTKGGLSPVPSNMLGQGRTYDADKHLEYLSNLQYFILVDIRESPMFKVYTVPSDSNFLLTKKISPKKFDLLVASGFSNE